MQNDQITSRRRRKRARKKPMEQQPAFIARPTFTQSKKNPNVWIATKTNVRPDPGPSSNLAQQPTQKDFVFSIQDTTQQQVPIVDLCDDTSPNTPLESGGGWKPVNTPTANNPPPVITMKKAQQKEEPDIKWELNVIEDKDVQTSAPTPVKAIPTPPTPQVVQGTASQIKLFKADKPMAATQKSGVPSTMSGNKSAMPANRSRSQSRFQSQHVQPTKTINSDARNEEMMALLYETRAYRPAGVPKSFLKQQNNMGAIQPQHKSESPPPERHPISVHYQNQPTVHENTEMTNPERNAAGRAFPDLHVNVNNEMQDSPTEEQQYSPSDVYDDGVHIEGEGSLSPDAQSRQKRLSAFRRLGPVSNPKKPKLTIKLSKDQAVRKVVDITEDEEKYTPVHLRKEVVESTHEVVVKFLPSWPWRRNVSVRKTVTARQSKSVMILEQEQMEEAYDKDNMFVQVCVRGYPRAWSHERVLDAMLDNLKGKSFVPCFVEFTEKECKFLVIRSRAALTAIHKLGFFIRHEDVELAVHISVVDISLKQVDFIPRLVLRKLLALGYDSERKLSLKGFTLGPDISNFIYFPLHRVSNQTELVQLQSTVAWDYLTDLDLSHNRLTSIDGFDLPKTTPKLRHLDLSHNHLERVTCLLQARTLHLRELMLEGNPLCHDYTDPRAYVTTVRMLFPGLVKLDSVPIHLKGSFPEFHRNFCPLEGARALAACLLETYYPLLEAPDERPRLQEIYHPDATLTLTYRYSLRQSSVHRKFRNLFLRARNFAEGGTDSVQGAANIVRLLAKWPDLRHDPYTFTVDCLHHSDTSTILRVDGIVKLTSRSLAEDEHLVSFSRTAVLVSEPAGGARYRVRHELLCWGEPTPALHDTAFQVDAVRTSRLSFKFDSPPDEEIKEKLTDIFMKITELDKKASVRCLELKEWHLRDAIEYFMKLVKLDDLSSLRKELEDVIN